MAHDKGPLYRRLFAVCSTRQRLCRVQKDLCRVFLAHSKQTVSLPLPGRWQTAEPWHCRHELSAPPFSQHVRSLNIPNPFSTSTRSARARKREREGRCFRHIVRNLLLLAKHRRAPPEQMIRCASVVLADKNFGSALVGPTYPFLSDATTKVPPTWFFS